MDDLAVNSDNQGTGVPTTFKQLPSDNGTGVNMFTDDDTGKATTTYIAVSNYSSCNTIYLPLYWPYWLD